MRATEGIAMLVAAGTMLALVPAALAGILQSLNLSRAKLIVQLGDSDGDGHLSVYEAADLVSMFGAKKTADDLDRFDLDGDGYLTPREVDDAFSLKSANLIRLLDADGDGLLAVSELTNFLKKLHIQVPEEILNVALDMDEDGYLSEEELDMVPDKLLNAMKRVPPLVAKRVESILNFAEERVESVVREMVLPMFKSEEVEESDED